MDQAAEHVCAVEAGHEEERAGEAVRGQVQTAIERADELVELTALEEEAQHDRQDEKEEESRPPVPRQRVEGEMACHAAREQDHRVDGRHVLERVQCELCRPRPHVILGQATWRGRRPRRVRAEEVEVRREQAREEHDLRRKEDVHAHHAGLDGRVLGLAGKARYRHQWWTSPWAAGVSPGYILTSSTRTHPTTPARKMRPPTTARPMRAALGNGIAARPRNSMPTQVTMGQLLLGNRWMPSSCARAS